jgi:hypothetical protein
VKPWAAAMYLEVRLQFMRAVAVILSEPQRAAPVARDPPGIDCLAGSVQGCCRGRSTRQRSGTAPPSGRSRSW